MNVNNSTQGNGTFPWTWTYPVAPHTGITLCSILLVWSLVGNVLVIAVVYSNKNLRTNMNYLIVNMAVSDLLVPLVAMPLNISWHATKSEWLVDGPLGDALCKLGYFFSELAPFVSSISLVIIAFQRFMAVVYPTRGLIFNRQTSWIAISFPWIVAMALHSPYLYLLRLTNKYRYTMCLFSWPPAIDEWTAVVTWTSIAVVVSFVVPLIIVIIMYSIVVHTLRKSLNNIRKLVERAKARLRQKRNRRIFSMLITIVVLFIICWCPLTVLSMLKLIAPSLLPVDSLYIMEVFFSFMWYLQAAINPCIYFVFLKDFRQGLKTLCCRIPT